MKKINMIWVVMALCSVQMATGQSVLGKWKTVDDRNGEAKAIVELYNKEGLLYGKIVQILEKGRENAKCIKCKGELKNRPITGMLVIDGFKESSGGEFRGKRLFDPEQGMAFKGKIWLDPDNANKLKVRGYLAFLYRTQTWLRAD